MLEMQKLANVSQGGIANQSVFPTEPRLRLRIPFIVGFQVTLTKWPFLVHKVTLMHRCGLVSCISPRETDTVYPEGICLMSKQITA